MNMDKFNSAKLKKYDEMIDLLKQNNHIRKVELPNEDIEMYLNVLNSKIDYYNKLVKRTNSKFDAEINVLYLISQKMKDKSVLKKFYILLIEYIDISIYQLDQDSNFNKHRNLNTRKRTSTSKSYAYKTNEKLVKSKKPQSPFNTSTNNIIQFPINK